MARQAPLESRQLTTKRITGSRRGSNKQDEEYIRRATPYGTAWLCLSNTGKSISYHLYRNVLYGTSGRRFFWFVSYMGPYEYD
jgi:hypothetical protein